MEPRVISGSHVRAVSAATAPYDAVGVVPPIAERPGLPTSYWKDSIASCSAEAATPRSAAKKSSEKNSEELVKKSVASWFANLWNSFLNLFGLGKSKESEAIDSVEGKSVPALEDPTSIEYAQMQQAIHEMNALIAKMEKLDESNKEEGDESLPPMDMLQLLIQTMGLYRKLMEEKWEIGQAHTLQNLKERREYQKEYNIIFDKYIKNNKWVTAANWANRIMTVANILLLAGSLVAAAFTGGLSAVVGALMFGLSTAAAIGSGVAGIMKGVTGLQHSQLTGKLVENRYYSNEVMEKIAQSTRQEMDAALQAINQLWGQTRQVLKSHREAAKQVAAA